MEPEDFIGSGFTFPLRLNQRGGFDLVRREQNIEQAIVIILSTPLGQRRMRPDFGCGIHDLVFEPNSSETHGSIRTMVESALQLWEPRIDLDYVDPTPDHDEPGLIVIDIGYTIRSSNELRNLVFPFYIIPPEES